MAKFGSEGVEICMIKPFMAQDEEWAVRRKNLRDHIRLLEGRYSEPERREAIAALRERLRLLGEVKLEVVRYGIQAK